METWLKSLNKGVRWGGGGDFYSIKFGRWIILQIRELMIKICVLEKRIHPIPLLDFGGHLCSLCYCLLDQTAHCVTDITKIRPTNFLLFSGYETPNSKITCTAWTHVRSYHDGCQFWGDFGFWRLCLKIKYQCVNILSFLNETLPMVIYCFVSVSEAEGILSWELSFDLVLSYHAVHRVHSAGVGRKLMTHHHPQTLLPVAVN